MRRERGEGDMYCTEERAEQESLKAARWNCIYCCVEREGALFFYGLPGVYKEGMEPFFLFLFLVAFFLSLALWKARK